MIDNSQRDLATSKQSSKIGRRKHIWPPKVELIRLYHELQWTLAKIASHFGVSKSLVQYWFKKYEISTRKRTGGHNKIPIPPKTELIRLYHELRWSLYHIAKYYGVTRPTVRSWFRTYNISVRNLSEAHRIIPMPSRETLIRHYHTHVWSLQQIANHYDVSMCT
ncbi:MAG: helix-turn-helix domain-containing protein, partial [Promethearchaeota archaeon]